MTNASDDKDGTSEAARVRHLETGLRRFALGLAVLLLCQGCNRAPEPAPAPAARPASDANPAWMAAARRHRTEHYLIATTATPEQAAEVGTAVERLHRAYGRHFADLFAANPARPPLSLVLYRNRGEFVANNRSHAWAEAYYRPPHCYAYYAGEGPNPYHWMLHEATHQLNREVAGWTRLPKWINEGVASYFGASRIEGEALVPGSVDPNAYPIWWLTDTPFSGNLQRDLEQGRVIGLRQLMTDTGPDIGVHLNLYYIEYWSLTHFLFHGQGGRYADGYRRLIAGGGDLAEFERSIGPLERIEREWYSYLQWLQAEQAIAENPDLLTPPGANG